jgi:hypothetical protein
MSAICVVLHLSRPYLGDDPLLQINQEKSSSLSLLPPYYTYIYKTNATKPRAGCACVTCDFGLRTSRVDGDGHANVWWRRPEVPGEVSSLQLPGLAAGKDLWIQQVIMLLPSYAIPLYVLFTFAAREGVILLISMRCICVSARGHEHIEADVRIVELCFRF